MIKILILLYSFTFNLISENIHGKGVICIYSDISNYSKFVAYIFKDRAEHYFFNQKREKIYLHKYSGYNYKTNDRFIILGNDFFKINKKSMQLLSQEDKILGICNFYNSKKKLLNQLELYENIEQKKIQ